MRSQACRTGFHTPQCVGTWQKHVDGEWKSFLCQCPCHYPLDPDVIREQAEHVAWLVETFGQCKHRDDCVMQPTDIKLQTGQLICERCKEVPAANCTHAGHLCDPCHDDIFDI